MNDIGNYTAFKKLLSAFQILCGIHPEIEKERLALAVSGGSDSMCLALMFQFLYTNGMLAKAPICLIVDHKLRTESTDEANFVMQYLLSKKIDSKIFTWHHDRLKSNIHHKAREARYGLMAEFCKLKNIKYVCTAHNYSDQAETILMRIIRGTGISGISGIESISKMLDITLLRPMLSIEREEIIELLKKSNWQWIEDPSNTSEIYERTKIRNLIQKIENSNITDGHLFKKRLNLLAQNAKRAKEFLEKHVLQKEINAIYYSKFNYALLNLEEILDIDDEILLRLLQRMLTKIGPFDESHIRLSSLLLLKNKVKEYIVFDKTHTTFKRCTLAGCNILALNNFLFLVKERRFMEDIRIDLTAQRQDIKWFGTKIDYALIYKMFPEAAYVGICNLDAWKIIKEQLDKVKENIIFYNAVSHIKMPYYEIIMSTPVVYDSLDKPLYSVTLEMTLQKI